MYSELHNVETGTFEAPDSPAETGNEEPLFQIEEIPDTESSSVTKIARSSYEGVHMIVEPVNAEMSAFRVTFVGSTENGEPDMATVLNRQEVPADGQWFQEVAGEYAHRLHNGVPVEKMFEDDESNIKAQIDKLREQLENL